MTEIFLINLPRDIHRLDNFKKHYNKHFHHIEAIDGSKEYSTCLFKNWPNLPPNTVNSNNYKALQMSMRKCIIAANEIGTCEWAVVCEDDAELPMSINFSNIVQNFKDSKVIWLDGRNRGGDGFTPGSCMNCVMYHKSVFYFIIKELHPDTSTQMVYWEKENPKKPMLNDFYIPWILKRNKIKVSSYPLVKSQRFKSTITTTQNHNLEYN